MLNLVIGVVIAVVVILLLIASSKPSTFVIERSAPIQAPPDRIFPLITDFRSWREWSPYERLDPNLKRSYSGAVSGVGAAYAWESGKAGSGTMQIVEAVPPSRIAIDLRFSKPMKAHNATEFLLQPEGGGTRVVWRMSGPQPFISKLMGVFINIDKMVGKDFEAGLGNLKAIAER